MSVIVESFSEREGIKPARKIIQSDSLDEALKNGLWNTFTRYYSKKFWYRVQQINARRGDPLWSPQIRKEFMSLFELFKKLWSEHLKFDLDKFGLDILDYHDTQSTIKKHFFGCPWYEVYDFVEFIANNCSDGTANLTFMDECNTILERELSAYRFINGIITPVVEGEQISAIDQALQSPISMVREHLEQAQRLLSNKKNPDYRNSIKESISAVECLCKIITGDEKATLGKALQEIEDKTGLQFHADLKEALRKLYHYTCDADGIRHALKNEPSLALEDAQFLLVACSAFVSYITMKSANVGITLQ